MALIEITDMDVLMIHLTDDGIYLTNQHGFAYTAGQLRLVASEMERFAALHEKDLNKLNARTNYELLSSLMDHRPVEKEQIKKSVYLMKSGDSYKVGISANVDRRFKEIGKHVHDLELLAYSEPIYDAYYKEHIIHNVLKNRNIKGEWFKLSSNEASVLSEKIRGLKDE